MTGRPNPRRQVLQTLVLRGLMVIVTLGAAVLTVRILGRDAFGTYALLNLVLGIAFVAGNLRLGPANTYFMARGAARPRDLVPLSLASGLLTGTCIAVPLGVALYLSGMVAPLPAAALAAVCALLPIRIVNNYLNGVLRGANRILTVNAVNHLGVLLRALTLIGLALVGVAFDLITVIALDVAAILVGTLVLVVALGRLPPGETSGSQPAPGWHAVHGYAGIAFAYMLAQTFNQRIDQFAITSLLGTHELAAYAVAVRFATLSWLIVESLQLVLAPHLARLPAEQRAGLLCRACQMMLLSVGALTLVVELTGGWLVEVALGAEFRDAVPPLRILTLAMALYCVNALVSSYYFATNRLADLTTNVAVLCAVNLVLTPVLTWFAGISGAALGTLLAFCVSTAMIVRRFSRDTGTAPTALVPTSLRDVQDSLRSVLETVGLVDRRPEKDSRGATGTSDPAARS